MISSRSRKIIGIVTSLVTLAIICLWSYWGINEAFHEGWYFPSLWKNIKLTFIQYLSIPIILIMVSVIALKNQRIGAASFMILGVFALLFFNSNAGRLLIFLPTALMTLGYYYAKFTHKKKLTISFVVLPAIILLTFGVPQFIRVENRLDDNNYGERVVAGNGVNLTWAPKGAGFPSGGTDWNTAKNNCTYLSKDGSKLENDPVAIWRLPTRDELVRSLTRGNKNANGYLNGDGNAQYTTLPDKETPLWDPHSQVIYYWSSESKDEDQAYLISYNGNILTRNKTSGANYLGYRCVRNNSTRE